MSSETKFNVHKVIQDRMAAMKISGADVQDHNKQNEWNKEEDIQNKYKIIKLPDLKFDFYLQD